MASGVVGAADATSGLTVAAMASLTEKLRLAGIESQVVETYRDGNSLVLVLADGRELRIEDYYLQTQRHATEDATAATGLIEDETAADMALARASLEEMFGGDGDHAAAAEATGSAVLDMGPQVASAAPLGGLGLPLGLTALVAAALGGDSGGGSSSPESSPAAQPQENGLAPPPSPQRTVTKTPTASGGQSETSPQPDTSPKPDTSQQTEADTANAESEDGDSETGTVSVPEDGQLGTSSKQSGGESQTGSGGSTDSQPQTAKQQTLNQEEQARQPDQTAQIGPGVGGPGNPPPPPTPQETALARILTSPQTATVDTFATAGVSGVTAVRLDSVKSLLGAMDDVEKTELGLDSLQYVADIVSRYVNPGATNFLDAAVSFPNGGTALEVEVDTDADGSPDRTMTYLHDGLSQFRIEFDDGSDGTLDRIDLDDDGDGTVDQIETRVFNSDGVMTLRSIDSNADGYADIDYYDEDADGSVDRTDTHVYDGQGRRSETRKDLDSDGTIDETLAIGYDAQNRVNLNRYTADGNDDGTPDSILEYRYDPDSGGRVVSYTSDGNADGTVEVIKHYRYDGNGRLVYSVEDDGGDGTADRVVFTDGIGYAYSLEAAEAVTLAGLDRVVLAGDSGSTTLRMTDEALTALADGESAYSLAIDGEDDDVVLLMGSGYALAGGTDSSGRIEYAGTGGSVFVDADVPVVTVGNPEAFEAILAAIMSRGVSPSAAQMQSIARIADYVPEGTEVDSASYAHASKSLSLEISGDPVYTEMYIRLNSGFAATYAQYSNSDSTRIKMVNDADADGNLEKATVQEYFLAGSLLEGLRQGNIARDQSSYDNNDDGTMDVVWIRQWLDGGPIHRSEQDFDADGRMDKVEVSGYDASGRKSYVVEDYTLGQPADGAMDRILFVDSVSRTVAPTAAEAVEFAGIDSVRMAQKGGASTLVLREAALAAIAGSDEAYRLTIDGDADDTLHLRGGSIVRDVSADAGGREAYTMDGSTVLVDADVGVLHIRNPQAFDKILGAFNGATRTGFSLAQMQSLVRASDYVPDDAEVLTARYGSQFNYLQLTVTGDPVYANIRINLNSDYAPTLVQYSNSSRTEVRMLVDDDADGFLNETHYHRNTADRTLYWERRVFDSDDDGTADVIWIKRYSPDGGALLRSELDTDADGTANNIEVRGYDGEGRSAYTAVDKTADGSMDSLTFNDGEDRAIAWDAAAAADLAGLNSIALAGGDGASTLSLSEAVLAALANGETGYTLRIDGDADDTVRFTDGEIARDSSADAGGREAYAAGGITVLIDPDVAVQLPS